MSNLAGKRTLVLFFLDKDIDDVLGRMVVSEHVVYTEHYCIENYLIGLGNLIEAVAVTTSLNRAPVRAVLSLPNREWMRRAAEDWKDWVKVCVFVLSFGIRSENYKVPSRLHKSAYDPLDRTLQVAFMSRLRKNWDPSNGDFDAQLTAVSQRIDQMYANDQQDAVFSGKWYFEFLIIDVQRSAAGKQYRNKFLRERLKDALLATITFEDPWSEHFRGSIKTALAKL